MQYILTYNNMPISRDGISNHFINCDVERWEVMTWSGLTNFDGKDVWSDGTNTYYSFGSTQYVLDVSTHTWSQKTWTGLTSFSGRYVWKNLQYNSSSTGRYIYSEGATAQMILSTDSTGWSTWSTTSNFLYGNCIWYERYLAGIRVYHSTAEPAGGIGPITSGETHIMNGDRWDSRTLKLYAENVWYTHDWPDDTLYNYYSQGTVQYNRMYGGSYYDVNWGALIPDYGKYVWHTDNATYYSAGNKQLVLNSDKTSWSNVKRINGAGVTDIYGDDVWTDGTDYYYSSGTTHYKMVRVTE